MDVDVNLGTNRNGDEALLACRTRCRDNSVFSTDLGYAGNLYTTNTMNQIDLLDTQMMERTNGREHSEGFIHNSIVGCQSTWQ